MIHSFLIILCPTTLSQKADFLSFCQDKSQDRGSEVAKGPNSARKFERRQSITKFGNSFLFVLELNL